MKYIDEYRDPERAKQYVEAIQGVVRRSWKIMEICGGQTHSIVKYGIDQLLPSEITLIHGPGCPVCVTPVGLIDQAICLAQVPGVVLCSFGDMLRVPGTREDLLSVKAKGGGVRIVYSPLDALKIAQQNPSQSVVFFAVGFETTAPATAMAVYQAQQQGIENFYLLVSHVLVPPAMEAILSGMEGGGVSDAGVGVQGFLAAGHVCTVMGMREYEPIVERYGIPMVVTGFEPVDILQGIYLCVQQLEAGKAVLENQYRRSVKWEGNRTAQELMKRVFRVVNREWRGIGEIPNSGLGLCSEYGQFDAQKRFEGELGRGLLGECAQGEGVPGAAKCISGDILRGMKKPDECEAFGGDCTPERPLGAPMVSSEGACAAYYRYRGQ